MVSMYSFSFGIIRLIKQKHSSSVIHVQVNAFMDLFFKYFEF